MSLLDIAVSEIESSDPEVRAVSVFGPTQRPHVFLNARTRWGQSSPVQLRLACIWCTIPFV